MRLHASMPAVAGLVRTADGTTTFVLKSIWLPGESGAIASTAADLSASVAHPDGGHLYYPSDLTPSKHRTDVVLAGVRSRAGHATLGVDEWRRELAVAAAGDEPATCALTTTDGAPAIVRLLPVAAGIEAYAARRYQFAEPAMTTRVRNMPRRVDLTVDGRCTTWTWDLPLCAFVVRHDGMRWDVDPCCDTIFVDASTRTLVLVHRIRWPEGASGDVFVHRGELDPSTAVHRARHRDDARAIGTFAVEAQTIHAFEAIDGWRDRAPQVHTMVQPAAALVVDADPLPFPPRRTARSAGRPGRVEEARPWARLTGLPFQQDPASSTPPRVAATEVVPVALAPRERVVQEHAVAPSPSAASPPIVPVVPIDMPVDGEPALPEADEGLETYARVRARLKSGERLDAALRSLSVEASVYRELDQRIALALAREARRGGSTLASRMRELIRAAAPS